MQNCLLVGDDIKIHGFPNRVTQKAAHVSLPCDDDQVHPYGKSGGANIYYSVPTMPHEPFHAPRNLVQ